MVAVVMIAVAAAAAGHRVRECAVLMECPCCMFAVAPAAIGRFGCGVLVKWGWCGGGVGVGSQCNYMYREALCDYSRIVINIYYNNRCCCSTSSSLRVQLHVQGGTM